MRWILSCMLWSEMPYNRNSLKIITARYCVRARVWLVCRNVKKLTAICYIPLESDTSVLYSHLAERVSKMYTFKFSSVFLFIYFYCIVNSLLRLCTLWKRDVLRHWRNNQEIKVHARLKTDYERRMMQREQDRHKGFSSVKSGHVILFIRCNW